MLALALVLVALVRLLELAPSPAHGTGLMAAQGPFLSGRPVQGKALTTSRGWSGAVRSYRYQWWDCSATGTTCVRIPGAASPTYVLQASDVGYSIESKVIACDSSCRASVSAPTAVVTTPSRTKNPSGAPVPPATVKDNFGTVWKREGYDNFTIKARLGSWGTSKLNAVVYRGDGGLRWEEAPDGWSCDGPEGFYPHCYEPSKVLSVHGGVLDFYLHDCRYAGGFYGACGAKPRPLMPSTGTPYQTYGRYSVRIKVVYDDSRRLDQYHAAWMLWPLKNRRGPCAESDYPEWSPAMNSSAVYAFAHWGCRGSFDWFRVTLNAHWHTLTQEWGPGFRRYYFDGKLIGQSKHQVWSGPERWQLQTEAHNKLGDTTRGHVLVDWVWLGVRKR